MINNAIEIMDGVPNDAYEITNVRRKTWLTTYPNELEGITKEDIEGAINRRTVEEKTNQRAGRIQNDKSYHTWVAKDNGVVVGFAEAQKKEDRNWICAFYILPDYQHMGIGSELMSKILMWLGDDKEIYFEVVKYNTNAINFYKKFGFVENGIVHTDVAKLPSGKELPEMEMIRVRTNSD